MFSKIQKLTFASLLAISVPIFVMISRVCPVKTPDVETDYESKSENEEINENTESNGATQVKLYMDLPFSLSDVINTDLKSPAKWKNVFNHFTNVSNVEAISETSFTNAGGNIRRTLMWAVHSFGASSDGLLNPQEEVQKFFRKPTVFEETEDIELKDILKGKKKGHRWNRASSRRS